MEQDVVSIIGSPPLLGRLNDAPFDLPRHLALTVKCLKENDRVDGQNKDAQKRK